MIIFDSIKNNRWSGKGVRINGGSLSVSSPANFQQQIGVQSGEHILKIVGRKRTGNGRLFVSITNDTGEIFLNQELVFSSSMWSEFSFPFRVEKFTNNCIIKIYRKKNSSGGLELGRIVVDAEESEAVRRSRLVRNRSNKRQILPDEQRSDAKFVHPKLRKKISKQKKLLQNKLDEVSLKDIVVIVPYGIYGGAEVYLKNIINGVSDERYHFHMVYMKPNALQNYISNPQVTHRAVKNTQQLLGFINSNRFDCIIYYNSLAIYQALTTAKSKNEIGGRLIEIYHSDFVWQDSLSRIKNRKNIDKLIRVSSKVGQSIKGLGTSDQVVLPVGVDLKRFTVRNTNQVKKSLSLNRDLVIGTVARLSAEKNTEYIFDMAERFPAAYFVLVGAARGQNELIERAKRLNNLHLAGFQNNVEDYYNAFDAFILPSKIEGTPVSILESMASGTPVFANNVGAISDIIIPEQTGYFLTGNLEQDFQMILDNYSNQEVINRARQFVVDKHNIEDVSAKFVEIISTLSDYYVSINNEEEQLVLNGEFI